MTKAKKIIYSLIFLIILEIFIGVKIYKSKNYPSSQNLSVQEKSSDGPFFSFSPKEGILKVGEVKEIKIIVNSKGKFLTGADAVINFDPNAIEIVNNPQAGEIFPFYPVLKVKPDKGEVDITGTITDPNQPHFQGEGVLAAIFIKPLKSGETFLKFNFTPGKTNDSNLAEKETGQDVLVKVENALFNIKP